MLNIKTGTIKIKKQLTLYQNFTNGIPYSTKTITITLSTRLWQIIYI